MKALPVMAIVASLGLVAACSRETPPLPGERFDVRTPLDDSAAAAQEATPESAAIADVPPLDPREGVEGEAPITLPGTVTHASWTHRGGNARHKVQHPALNSTLTKLWSVNIGTGNSRKHRISGDPVVADGRIYTVDSQARVNATSLEGRTLWSRDLTPASDRNSEASGGGAAYGAGRLFVTTGFGELIALDPASGDILWKQGFDAPVSGAPTVVGDLVYVVSRDNASFGVDVSNGRLKWQLPGTPSPSVMISGAGPAVTDRLALFPNGQSEVIATLRQGGIRVWSAIVAGERRGRAYTGVTDITGDPVVAGNKIYVGTQSGRFAALSLASGERLWTAQHGAYSPGWPVGGSVFIVSDQGQLVRVDDDTGETIWAVDLPYFKREKLRRRKAVYAHYGPVLAGGRLLVASDDGMIRSFDPRNGALLSELAIPGGAASLPAIVNGTLYILSGNGQLHAFR